MKKRLPLRYLYTFLFYLILPFILLRLLWRSRRLPDYRLRISERFGYYPGQLKSCIWVHAVSVGETIAAIPLIKVLKKVYPQEFILITNMTPTGAARVKAAFGDTVMQAYIPYDLPGAVARFLDRVNPKISIILETELWPNLLDACKKRHIPVLITNARLSEKSRRGYQYIASLTRQLLAKITFIAAQSQADAQRFIQLGLAPNKIAVTGNLKFDLEIPADLLEKGELLRQQLGKSRPVWIAASTHRGEEAVILAVHKMLLEQDPATLLVLVPRHPDRFDEVADLIKTNNFHYIRRSGRKSCDASTQIYLADTMGELLLLYAASDIAFVGGSLVSVGGHNLLEPAALKKPVLSGPVLFNFAEISQQLLVKEALTIAHSASELFDAISVLFNNESLRKQQGDHAYQVIEENRGALAKQLELIHQQLMDSL